MLSYLKIRNLFLSIDHNQSGLLKWILPLLNTAPFIILFSIIFLYGEMIAPFVFSKFGGVYDAKHISSLVFLVCYALLCFLVAPAIIGKIIFNESTADLGLRMPIDKGNAVILALLAFLMLEPPMFFFSTLPSFRAYYGLGNPSLLKFIFIHVTVVPLYYFGEEFFFRGFLFLGLWKRIGWHSYWVTEIIFTVAHVTKPGFEILFSIPAGIVLSYITRKTQSIYPAMFVHYMIGVFLNISVNFV